MLKNPWWTILIAIVFESGWVVGIKYAHTPIEWILTIASLVTSFGLYLLASRHLPVGTTYAVFVGLGSAATVLIGWLVFGDGLTVTQLIFLLILLVGVIGLKLVEEDQD
ncbi:multidrug efflux SMR transporter [Weissella uvarum]|nr:multidrug efflux SMR transporter [Weissella uvarum]